MNDGDVQFERLVGTIAPKLLGYATRRVATPADAADVVAEVLLVAWRRFGAMPAGEEERVRWLYGVARRVLANHRRGRLRQSALTSTLRLHLEQVAPAPATVEALHVRAALGRLRADDRELLCLIAWEGLAPAEAAGVLGISPTRARKRLQRARERLRAELADGEPLTHAEPVSFGRLTEQRASGVDG
ncbi:MAG: RNA polymerase sigma factor [Gaiellaceae bacterium MAG52_C11]|nr:RNA polymerase sigma factor [Candidatus Gaiellasilicea maunaloa]